MRTPRILLRIVMASAAAGTVWVTGACTGGKNNPVPRVSEVEPNDDFGHAGIVTRNWSNIFLGGTCASSTDEEWWIVTFATYVPVAPIFPKLSWSGAGMLDLTLFDALGTTILDEDSGPSPSNVSGSLTTGGTFVLRVQCIGAGAGTPWTIDIPAPGLDPTSED